MQQNSVAYGVRHVVSREPRNAPALRIPPQRVVIGHAIESACHAQSRVYPDRRIGTSDLSRTAGLRWLCSASGFRESLETKNEGRQARSSRLPVIPLSGNPISLTEGG